MFHPFHFAIILHQRCPLWSGAYGLNGLTAETLDIYIHIIHIYIYIHIQLYIYIYIYIKKTIISPYAWFYTRYFHPFNSGFLGPFFFHVPVRMMRAVWIDSWVSSFSTWPWPQDFRWKPLRSIHLDRRCRGCGHCLAVDNPDDGSWIMDHGWWWWMMDDDDGWWWWWWMMDYGWWMMDYGWRMRDDDGWWMMDDGRRSTVVSKLNFTEATLRGTARNDGKTHG